MSPSNWGGDSALLWGRVLAEMLRLGERAGASCNSGEARRLSPPILSLAPCFLGRSRPPTLDVREAAMLQKAKQGTSLMLHWLRFRASNAGGTSSIPRWRTEVPSAVLWSQKKKKIPSEQKRNKQKTTGSQAGKRRVLQPHSMSLSPHPAQPMLSMLHQLTVDPVRNPLPK